jgi:hypothetical protein
MQPFIEKVKATGNANAGPDDPLDFYSAALQLGATKAEAETISIALTIRVMKARGAI